MILPIVAYGHPTLRKISKDIDSNYPDLELLIENMRETMKGNGVGLAAPQINKNIRLFIIDATPFSEEHPETVDFKKTFFNAKITDRFGKKEYFNEGCLSVPDINEDIERASSIKIEYYDEEWNFHEKEYDGIIARIIQHEYDHLEGKLLVDHVSPIRKTLLSKKLKNISEGKIDPKYRMIFKHKR